MADGAGQVGPMDEKSTPCPTGDKVVISRDRVLMLLIVLVVTMTGVAPDQAVVLLRLIGL
jgi:hypothetical protein